MNLTYAQKIELANIEKTIAEIESSLEQLYASLANAGVGTEGDYQNKIDLQLGKLHQLDLRKQKIISQAPPPTRGSEPAVAPITPVPKPAAPQPPPVKPTQPGLTELPEMVFVQGGAFKMGSNDGGENEKPVHRVVLDDFYIGKYPVTVFQFAAFIKETHYVTTAESEGSSYVFIFDR